MGSVDMSPAAITARLREVSSLYALCLTLSRARKVRPAPKASVEELLAFKRPSQAEHEPDGKA